MDLKQQIKHHLAEQYGFPMEEVEELYRTARDTVSGGLNRMGRHIKEERFDAVASDAHTLKGSFLNMGLDDIADITRNLEGMAKDDRSESVLICYKSLREKTALIIQTLP